MSRPWPWILGIGVALLALTAIRVGVQGSAALGLSLPSAVPIVLAAYRFGRRGGLAAAAASTVLFVVGELAVRAGPEGEELLVATSTRGLVFFGIGILVAELVRRTAEQAGVIAQQAGELEELRIMREAMVPSRLPATPGVEVGVAHSAADGPVAGDFFLVVPGPAGSTVLAVGDAAGHSLAAARRASFVRAVLASLAATTADPARLLALANAALTESAGAGTDFITAVCGSVADGRFTWASAGHPAPWDLDSGEELAGPGPGFPLGIFPELECDSSVVELPPGRGVLMFSDGLVEARAAGGELREGRRLLGEDEVRAAVGELSGGPPGAVADALRLRAVDFAGPRLADDLCVLAARRSAG